jgi:hypothetical protein
MYLVEKNKLNKETINFYKRDTWRKMKFRQYSYGKKSIDTFLNKKREEEKVRPSKLILHFCIFLTHKSAF